MFWNNGYAFNVGGKMIPLLVSYTISNIFTLKIYNLFLKRKYDKKINYNDILIEENLI